MKYLPFGKPDLIISIKKENNNHFIKMFPQNPDKSKYHTIIMKVDESSNTIKQSTVKTKDGVNIKITITNLTGNPAYFKKYFLLG